MQRFQGHINLNEIFTYLSAPTILKIMSRSQKSNVNLTFNPVTWFLFATHHLIMMIICVNFFFKIAPRTP